MRAGRLRKRVIIERASTAVDEYGEEIETWATLTTVWAGVEPVSGKERIQGGQAKAITTHLIIMRHTDITNNDRINLSGRIFNIESVINRDERNKELQIMAVENV